MVNNNKVAKHVGISSQYETGSTVTKTVIQIGWLDIYFLNCPLPLPWTNGFCGDLVDRIRRQTHKKLHIKGQAGN